MKNGIRIAKPGNTVESPAPGLYVSTDTPLLKVKELVTGSLEVAIDGTFKYTGKYPIIGTNTSGAVSNPAKFFELYIPHGFDYAPVVMAYCDLKNRSMRMYLTSRAAGVSVRGDIAAFAQTDNTKVRLFFATNGNFGATYPAAGSYRYAVYIYHDKVAELE